MLTHLSIKNYALIRKLDIDFQQGLHIITGETGAGKSILLGALGLVLGERAESRSLHGEEKCVVEAEFELKTAGLKAFFEANDLDYAETTVLRRELSAGGKSRAFVNDTPVQLNILKELGEGLVDIHSQHETLSLKDRLYQLELLDSYAGNGKLLAGYREHFAVYRSVKQRFETLLETEAALKTEYDFQLYQLKELMEAKLREGEQEELEQELQMLENAGEIVQLASGASELLKDSEGAILDKLSELQIRMKQTARVDKRFESLAERLQSVHIEMSDISSELEHIAQNTASDEKRLEQVNERLSLLYNLQKKYRSADITELMEIQNNLEESTSRVEHFDEELQQLKTEKDKALQTVNEKAAELTASRTAAVNGLSRELQSMLADLGMPNAIVKVQLHAMGKEPAEYGNESAELLFSSNAGSPPLPVNKIASGGELSRLMLCVKSLLAANKSLPTLIFDEIDTGISGEVAQKTGKLMKKLANGHQVISVTHLPQIAGAGEHHYYVFKEIRDGLTFTGMKQLNPEERVEEIARMLSGENPTASALANVRELMGIPV